jgi:L-alanine-DL-glutamate epimerase-like enolase superfamily enzyme
MIRRTVGDENVLMVDGNQSRRSPGVVRQLWRLKDALELARELERLEVYWLEDALPRGDVDGMIQLRRGTRIRIAGGAMALELHDLSRLIEGQCLDIVQPDATRIGGITGLASIARMAARRGVGFTPHTWGNGLGLIANAQLAAGIGGCPYLEFPYDPPEWNLERRDYFLRGPITLDDDGCLTLPDEPGLGIELDEERLAATLPAAPVKVEVVESTLTQGIRRLVHGLRG